MDFDIIFERFWHWFLQENLGFYYKFEFIRDCLYNYCYFLNVKKKNNKKNTLFKKLKKRLENELLKLNNEECFLFFTPNFNIPFEKIAKKLKKIPKLS